MTTATAEYSQSADRFGGSASIHVAAPDAPALVERGLRLLAEHDRRLSRFRPYSDLSRLNRDPERRVTTTSLVTDLAVAAIEAGRMTGGLVDATVLPAVRRAGYEHHLDAAALDSAKQADFRTDARPATPGFGWREIRVLPHLKTIVRPPGVEIDSGGLAKGMAADVVARTLEGTGSYCVECAGDLVVGGTAGLEREVSIPTPFTESDPEILLVSNGAVATSGITRRSWRAPGGRLAHHLIDPGRGEPAFTGVLQATALAPTGFEAEVRAKAALLAGADAASEYLPHGGILMLDSGEIVRLDEGASLTPDIHLLWITAKAAGLTAMVLASASVSVGLMMSARGRRTIEWRKAHEWLSLLTLGMIGLHGLALLLDPWLHPGWAGVLVPFASSYRPAATAAGVVAAWGLTFLGLSYYLRARIGAARWRRWHRWTALFWILGVAHGILAGTDGSTAWMLVIVGLTGIPPALLLLARILPHGGAPRAGGRMPARVPVSDG